METAAQKPKLSPLEKSQSLITDTQAYCVGDSSFLAAMERIIDPTLRERRDTVAVILRALFLRAKNPEFVPQGIFGFSQARTCDVIGARETSGSFEAGR